MISRFVKRPIEIDKSGANDNKHNNSVIIIGL